MKKQVNKPKTDNQNRIDLSSMSRNELERYAANLQTEVSGLSAKLTWYEEQFKLSQAKKFGQSSEAQYAGQMTLDDFMLFNEAEALREPMNFEPKEEDILKTNRKKGKHKKNIRRI